MGVLEIRMVRDGSQAILGQPAKFMQVYISKGEEDLIHHISAWEYIIVRVIQYVFPDPPSAIRITITIVGIEL